MHVTNITNRSTTVLSQARCQELWQFGSCLLHYRVWNSMMQLYSPHPAPHLAAFPAEHDAVHAAARTGPVIIHGLEGVHLQHAGTRCVLQLAFQGR
jgi:hypothetical protein